MFLGGVRARNASLDYQGGLRHRVVSFGVFLAFLRRSAPVRVWRHISDFGFFFWRGFSSLGDGSYTDETIIVTDAVGNVATLNISQFTIDTIRPSMTITATGVNSGETTNDATLSLTFTSSKATTDFIKDDITTTNGSVAE